MLKGAIFIDASGRRYLDFPFQLVCCNFGHKNRNVVNAIKEYAEKLPYISPIFTCDVRD